jgi:hypothetical protein
MMHKNWKVRRETAVSGEAAEEVGKFEPVGKSSPSDLAIGSRRRYAAEPHYHAASAQLRHVAARMQSAGHLLKPVAADDMLGIFNIHCFLDEINMGSGLAFLLHSTISADKHELRMGEQHGAAIVTIGYWKSHVWTTIPRMRRNQAMLFCTAHTDGRVVPHSAYSVDTTAKDYRPRHSFELRMLVREPRRPAEHRVAPVPIKFTRPVAASSAPPLLSFQKGSAAANASSIECSLAWVTKANASRSGHRAALSDHH